MPAAPAAPAPVAPAMDGGPPRAGGPPDSTSASAGPAEALYSAHLRQLQQLNVQPPPAQAGGPHARDYGPPSEPVGLPRQLEPFGAPAYTHAPAEGTPVSSGRDDFLLMQQAAGLPPALPSAPVHSASVDHFGFRGRSSYAPQPHPSQAAYASPPYAPAASRPDAYAPAYSAGGYLLPPSHASAPPHAQSTMQLPDEFGQRPLDRFGGVSAAAGGGGFGLPQRYAPAPLDTFGMPSAPPSAPRRVRALPARAVGDCAHAPTSVREAASERPRVRRAAASESAAAEAGDRRRTRR